MNQRMRRYFAEIGSRGGRKSRRSLDAETARSMVRAREARRTIRRIAELDSSRLRAMSPAQKLNLMNALWRQARSLAATGVKLRNPQWDEARVREAVRELMRRDTG